MSEQKNKLGYTLKAYTCACGYVNASKFVRGEKPYYCFRCHKPLG